MFLSFLKQLLFCAGLTAVLAFIAVPNANAIPHIPCDQSAVGADDGNVTLWYSYDQAGNPSEDLSYMTYFNEPAGEIRGVMLVSTPNVRPDEPRYVGLSGAAAVCILREKIAEVIELGVTTDEEFQGSIPVSQLLSATGAEQGDILLFQTIFFDTSTGAIIGSTVVRPVQL